MADLERSVLLGTVQERQSVDDASPYACKAGGTPAWYDHSAPPPDATSLTCPRCTKPLFLVTQVYAPVDTHRTLYVFGCNSVACTETPGSWRVLRDESAMVEATAPAEPAASSAQSQLSSMNAWDAGADSDSSDWGDNDDDDSNDPFASTSGNDDTADISIDLERLLLQRDDAISAASAHATAAATTTKKPSSKSSPVSASGAPSQPTLAFPAKPIDVVDEPFEDYTAEHDYAHERALLDDYMKQEDEDKSTDVSDLRKLLANSSNVKKKNESSAAAAEGTGSSKTTGEAYEKTPAQQRHFLRFQKRISRAPMQCLRYDYGGEPLWPVIKPQRLDVPTCRCGEARVFEFQLTPTLLYVLKVDAFATPVVPTMSVVAARAALTAPSGVGESPASAPAPVAAPPRAHASTGASGTGGGAMDWMGVLVYSCPKSCAQSHEEFVYVLPAEKA